MTPRPRTALVTAALLLAATSSARAMTTDTVRVAEGVLQGTVLPDGMRTFFGVPFAAPPLGDLRWKAPQPASDWTGVRRADAFGPRCMQHRIFDDIVFRSPEASEDCLYLNVWTPARAGGERLPVLVYFHGGGFVAGDGSEPRYDGESMARRGIVTVTVNYRLGVFGFLAHPELTAESPEHASGNYGLLDQAAALRWVRRNIAAFGGDPTRVTIAGESAGSVSVSAQMASPLARGLIAGAIGESGAMIEPTLAPVPLAAGERNGLDFAGAVGAPSIAELRSRPAQEVLDAAAKHGVWSFRSVVDGYFLPVRPAEIFAAGQQARVPLLVGWNSEEAGHRALLGQEPPTPEGYARAVRRVYGEHADEVLRLYPGGSEEQVLQSATDLAGDRFIAYSTWKWADLHASTSGRPVYRYLYTRPRPAPAAGAEGGNVPRGAVHAAEIEYALGNLDRNSVYAWTPEDHRVSATMQGYFANFIRSGDPNGPALPRWPAARPAAAAPVLRIDVQSEAVPDRWRERYLLLDRIYGAPARR